MNGAPLTLEVLRLAARRAEAAAWDAAELEEAAIADSDTDENTAEVAHFETVRAANLARAAGIAYRTARDELREETRSPTDSGPTIRPQPSRRGSP